MSSDFVPRFPSRAMQAHLHEPCTVPFNVIPLVGLLQNTEYCFLPAMPALSTVSYHGQLHLQVAILGWYPHFSVNVPQVSLSFLNLFANFTSVFFLGCCNRGGVGPVECVFKRRGNDVLLMEQLRNESNPLTRTAVPTPPPRHDIGHHVSFAIQVLYSM